MINVSAHSLDHVPYVLMTAAHLFGGMPYVRSQNVDGELADCSVVLPEESKVLSSRRSHMIVAELAGALLMIDSSGGRTDIQVVGTDQETVDRLVERTVALAHELVIPPPPSTVRIRMWWDDGEPAWITRAIDSRVWDEINSGYAASTRAHLAGLMARRDAAEGEGRLLLWHGPPGTGKTTAVRTLAREWRSWCDVHYVSDPERLFARPGYLLTVAGSAPRDTDDGRWRLVVAEDCDEYLRSDAKHRAGASLGRLLNLSDGILGNGLRVLVLLTTNEDVGRLHPAITRPGRCLGQIRFDPFGRDEAREWLGPAYEVSAETLTLAEMYALRSDRSTESPEAGLVGGYL